MSAGAKLPRDQDATAHRGGRRSATRLVAVQALYEMEMAGTPADAVLRQFKERRWGPRSEEESGAPLAEPNSFGEDRAESRLPRRPDAHGPGHRRGDAR